MLDLPKIWILIVARFESVVYSFWVKMKYWPCIANMRHVKFSRGVQFVSLNSKKRVLNVRFEGNNTVGSFTVFKGDSGLIRFGRNSFCGSFCVFGAMTEIIIGSNVMIADAVTIRTVEHYFDKTDVPMNKQGVYSSSVAIEDDVWLGHGVTILKGIKIGKGSVIAAGAVVVKDVPAYSIMGGVPAKLIRSR